MDDGTLIHGLLFKTDDSKGLIFYLHGNAGSLRSWGGVAKTYTDLGFDVFMVDYRGYGKSGGKISGEKQLFSDMQQVYSSLRNTYEEEKLIVLGYSIGSGPATCAATSPSPGCSSAPGPATSARLPFSARPGYGSWRCAPTAPRESRSRR